MNRLISALAGAIALAFAATGALAGDTANKLAVHIDQNDPELMSLALNNVENVAAYYKAKGEKVQIEVVAYGPGLNMYIDASSPVKARLATMALELPDVKFSACGNTHSKMQKKAGKDIKLVSEASMVDSGVVRLMQLQQQGYSYIRP